MTAENFFKKDLAEVIKTVVAKADCSQEYLKLSIKRTAIISRQHGAGNFLDLGHQNEWKET